MPFGGSFRVLLRGRKWSLFLKKSQWILGFLLLLTTNSAFALSLSTIQSAAQKSNSVESFLSSLPETDRSVFTLIYKGNGLQESSVTSPRVLLFDPQGKNYLTFTSDPSMRGGHSVEWLSYDKLKGFQFREIIFEKGFKESSSSRNSNLLNRQELAKKIGLLEEDLDAARGAVINSSMIMSVSNPTKCLSCHQSLMNIVHPIWNSYPHWPGVVGSFDDQVFTFQPSKEEGVHMPWSQFGTDIDREAPLKEYKILKQTRESAGKNPRLKLLRGWESLYEVKLEKDFLDEPDYSSTVRNLSPLVNTRITTLLMVSTAEQLAQKWMTTNAFQKNKKTIFYGVYCDSRALNSLVPNELMGGFNSLKNLENIFGEEKYLSRKWARSWLISMGVTKWPEELHFDQNLPSGDTGVNSGLETTELFKSSQNYITGWVLALAFQKSFPEYKADDRYSTGMPSTYLQTYSGNLSSPAMEFLKQLDLWNPMLNFDQLSYSICPLLKQ